MLKSPGMLSAPSNLILLTVMIVVAHSSLAQTSKSPEKHPASPSDAAPMSSDELEATRQQLFKLLRISPKLTTVIAQDPSLLADEQYISRNNPALEQFLQTHPEVVRSPEFYLFANLGNGPRANGPVTNRELRLEGSVWPELVRHDEPRAVYFHQTMQDLFVFVTFVSVLLSLLWLIRILLENRRWTRVFNRQSEAQNKLLEKFSSSEEMLNYMRSDSGKHFLEFTTVPASFSRVLQSGSPLARVLTPLQFGIVLTLVGVGFLILKSESVASGQLWGSDAQGPLLVLGVLTSTLGVGLMVSAGISWALARHLGILPAAVEGKGQHSADEFMKAQ